VGQKPDVFIFITFPLIIVASAAGYILYARIVRPSPVALGSLIPKFCVVSVDEIGDYCERTHGAEIQVAHGQTRGIQVAQKYLAQMSWNTRLIQQLARFEKLKIDPLKSSLDYESRETLILQLTEEATAVRWLLLKSRLLLLTRVFSGTRVSTHVADKLKHLMREYKQLEFNASHWSVWQKMNATTQCLWSGLDSAIGTSDKASCSA
jgi:hypothetical protein